jgi:hypothetical protein
MKKMFLTILVVFVILGSVSGCSKKNDTQSSEVAALAKELKEMKAQLEAAQGGNATPEEITKLETAVTEVAQQEEQKQKATTADLSSAASNGFQLSGTVLTKYNGTSKSVTIPDGVTRIGDSAFERATITSVTIPDSVTTIGKQTFGGCRSLSSITIPDSVTNIDMAFVGCHSLTSINIPNKVTTIVQSTFQSCTSLKSVTIGNSVTRIEDSAFNGCPITSITIPNNVTYLSGFDGTSLTRITIPDSVITIGNYAFYGCPFSNVTIPNNVKSIGENAFRECPNLTSVTFQGTIPSGGLHTNAFYGLGDLRDRYLEMGPGTYTKNGSTWTKEAQGA